MSLKDGTDEARKTIAALESQLAALKEPPTDGDAAYWHTAWKVLEAELQAKTAEVEWMTAEINEWRENAEAWEAEAERLTGKLQWAYDHDADFGPDEFTSFEAWFEYLHPRTTHPSQGGGE